MIGILCDDNKEKTFAKHFNSLFKPLLKGKAISVTVFNLSNVNLVDKTVSGSLVSQEAVIPVENPMPSVIFNFSVQHSRAGIKKMRSLNEVEGLLLINSANRYDQRAIMEMLASDNTTRSFLLPLVNFDEHRIFQSFESIDNYIIKPERGTNLSRITYINHCYRGLNLAMGQRNPYFGTFVAQNGVKPLIEGNKAILLRAPELIMNGNELFVARVYLQKGEKGKWKILARKYRSGMNSAYGELIGKTGIPSKQIINYINCFIPDLGIGFIDFIFDTNGTPYFLNFGGWDNKLLGRKQPRSIQINLCKNILEYAGTVINISKGDEYCVD